MAGGEHERVVGAKGRRLFGGEKLLVAPAKNFCGGALADLFKAAIAKLVTAGEILDEDRGGAVLEDALEALFGLEATAHVLAELALRCVQFGGADGDFPFDDRGAPLLPTEHEPERQRPEQAAEQDGERLIGLLQVEPARRRAEMQFPIAAAKRHGGRLVELVGPHLAHAGRLGRWGLGARGVVVQESSVGGRLPVDDE